MQFTATVFVLLIVYGVSCFRIEKTSPSVFYKQLEELFQAFNQNDTDRVEEIFDVLKTSKYPELDEPLDANSTTNYARGFHNYVVRWFFIQNKLVH